MIGDRPLDVYISFVYDIIICSVFKPHTKRPQKTKHVLQSLAAQLTQQKVQVSARRLYVSLVYDVILYYGFSSFNP